VEIFDILGPHSHPPAPIQVKCCTAKRTQVPVGYAKFDVNRCNESPLGVINLIFGLWVNLITAGLETKASSRRQCSTGRILSHECPLRGCS